MAHDLALWSASRQSRGQSPRYEPKMEVPWELGPLFNHTGRHCQATGRHSQPAYRGGTNRLISSESLVKTNFASARGSQLAWDGTEIGPQATDSRVVMLYQRGYALFPFPGLKIIPSRALPFITTRRGSSKRRCLTHPASSAPGCAANHAQSTEPSPASGFTVK